MSDNRNRGLYGKYNVTRLDENPLGQCIVLELKDPNNWPALYVWADSVEKDGYIELATNMRNLLAEEAA